MSERIKGPDTMDVNLMTETTYKRLQDSLEGLKEDLARAKLRVGEAAGPSYDWHDNFPFEQARRDVEMYTSQVESLQRKLKSVEFIKPNQNTEKVQIGNTVVVQFGEEPETSIFTILGPDDSDKKRSWISYKAPIAAAMLNKKPGEAVIAKTPSGNLSLKIIEILPGQFD